MSGLQIYPNLYDETIMVDSTPGFLGSSQGSDKSTVLLMVDPHCSFKISAAVSVTAAAGRFVLLYSSKIIGFSMAVVFFALMLQVRAWELDLPLPSLLTAVESNLRMPMSFLLLAVLPIVVSLLLSFLTSELLPPLASFFVVSIICYAVANGFVIILILISQLTFYFAANVQVFTKLRWEMWEENLRFTVLRRFINVFSIFFSHKAIRILKGNSTVVTASIASILVFFVHPALGLIILFLSHVLCCHIALSSFLGASFRSQTHNKELFGSKTKGGAGSRQTNIDSGNKFGQFLPLEENSSISPNSGKSYGDTQLEIFNYRHAMLMLHLLATLMFLPSLLACLQGIGMGHKFPWFLDSALCLGVILHALYGSKLEFISLSIPFPGVQKQEVGLSFVYFLAGYYCYFFGLDSAPYRAFDAMAAVGIISCTLRIMERRNSFSSSQKHSHRH